MKTMREEHAAEIQLIKLRHQAELKQYEDSEKTSQDITEHTMPQLIVKRSPIDGFSLGVLTLQRTFVCDIEATSAATNAVTRANGSILYAVCSEFVAIEGGQVALRLEKNIKKTSNTYLMHLMFKKDDDVEQVDAEWQTDISWKTKTKNTKICKSSTNVSHSFLLGMDQKGSIITPGPSKKSELNVNLKINNWVVKRAETQQLIEL